MRLDLFLVSNNLAGSRQKAQDLISQGFVTVDDKQCTKASLEITSQAVAVSEDSPQQFVGRGGRKLLGFLESSSLDVSGKLCLDAGASTGGFCEVLLLKGATKVVCVDVGTAQLAPSLLNDERVQNFEQTDMKNFSYEQIFDIAVCDLSFTSVLPFLPIFDRLVKGDIVILFKPQFEVGKNAKRNRRGVVTDQNVVLEAKQNFVTSAENLGWKLIEQVECKVSGREGNLEFFYRFSN